MKYFVSLVADVSMDCLSTKHKAGTGSEIARSKQNKEEMEETGPSQMENRCSQLSLKNNKPFTLLQTNQQASNQQSGWTE